MNMPLQQPWDETPDDLQLPLLLLCDLRRDVCAAGGVYGCWCAAACVLAALWRMPWMAAVALAGGLIMLPYLRRLYGFSFASIHYHVSAALFNAGTGSDEVTCRVLLDEKQRLDADFEKLNAKGLLPLLLLPVAAPAAVYAQAAQLPFGNAKHCLMALIVACVVNAVTAVMQLFSRPKTRWDALIRPWPLVISLMGWQTTFFYALLIFGLAL
ncbi:MAG: hypothetical protein IJ354_08070 [Clostridia bacterium]|nr:hypothetical protein [Clostridia bacterium]